MDASRERKDSPAGPPRRSQSPALRRWQGHAWPRAVKPFVPDLWIRLPEAAIRDHGRVAALTFDDGPTERGTDELLEVLAQHRVPATFFLLGENVRRWPRMARAITTAGHAIGNHFRTHIDCWRSSRRTVVREVTEGGRILEDVLGIRPPWCRPPFGRLAHTIVKWSRLHRQQLVLWDIFPVDYLAGSSLPAMSAAITRRIVPGSIVCLHDSDASREKTPALLRSVLPRLFDEGWQFVRLPEPEWGVAATPSRRTSAA